MVEAVDTGELGKQEGVQIFVTLKGRKYGVLKKPLGSTALRTSIRIIKRSLLRTKPYLEVFLLLRLTLDEYLQDILYLVLIALIAVLKAPGAALDSSFSKRGFPVL